MQKVRKLILVALAAIFMGSTGSVAVLAHDGEDHGDSNRSSSRRDGDDDNDRNNKRNERRRKNSENAKKWKEEWFKKAQAEQEARRLKLQQMQDRKEKRRLTCEERKAKIEAWIDRRASNAQKHLNAFTNVYGRIVAYKESKQLNPVNWDALIVAADAAQDKAEASVAAVQSLKPTVTCENETIATDLAAFRDGLKQAREDLKAYRVAIKDVFKAVIVAAKEAEQ